LWVAALLTVALGAAATRLQVNATLDRLKATTPGALFEEQVRHDFGLPSDVFILLQRGRDLEPLLQENERVLAELKTQAPALALDGGSSLLPSDAAQRHAIDVIRQSGLTAQRAADLVRQEARDAGFTPGSLDPFISRLPALLDPGSRLTYADFSTHRLGDLIRRFIVQTPDGWTLASYAFPADRQQRQILERVLRGHSGVQLTGLTLVNEELAARFLPQFARGLAVGSVVVLLLILLMFRDWRLSLLSTLPTVVGLVWAAGVLALFGVSLDLFAVFAVVTFVGIGIDYGIHVVHRYQDTGDSREAVSHLAPVIVVAGLITLFGYGTLMTSSYPPLRSMGIVSIVSVVTLVAASLLMLPALLPDSRAPRATSVAQEYRP
jgi:predicted exporter